MKREIDKGIINGTIAFIESRLTENLKINDLAEQSYFSKAHFQRLFHSIVGETVMEYVKKRRLQLAVSELCDTKTPIFEIALKYGYESHEGFTRAFKSYYGVTPSRYRKLNKNQKNYFNGGATKMGKASNEAVSRIKTNLVTISTIMEQSVQNAMGLSENMKKMGDSLGRGGGTFLICAAEVCKLVKKMEALKESINKFTEHEQIAFGVYGGIHTIIKHLDDIGFQTRLLRLLTGIHMAYAKEPKDVFLVTIQKQFAELDLNMENNANNMLNLINDMVSIIRADIKNDAEVMIKDAIGLLKNTINEGKAIVSSAKNEADAAGIHGKGLRFIANNMSNEIETFMFVIELLGAYLKNPVPDSCCIEEIKSAIDSVEEVTLSMNIIAFDAALEAARSPNVKGFHDCYHNIAKYAGDIQQSYQSCAELFSESVKLSEMLKNSVETNKIALMHKMIGNILFHGKILVTHLGAKAEFNNDEAFKNLAINIDRALHIVFAVKREKDMAKCKDALIKYNEIMLKYNHDLHAQAKTAGAKDIPFEYIVSEFDVFIKKIQSGIDFL